MNSSSRKEVESYMAVLAKSVDLVFSVSQEKTASFFENNKEAVNILLERYERNRRIIEESKQNNGSKS